MMARILSCAVVALTWCAGLGAAVWVAVEILGSPIPPDVPASACRPDPGSGFRARRDKQHILVLEGAPYALGYHNSRLTGRLMRVQEEELLDALFAFAGGPGRAMLIHRMSLAYLTGLDNYLLPREQLEILGLAQGVEDPFPDMGPRYARIAAYHALHELSHRFAFDNPLFASHATPVGCSLVAVGSARGEAGHAFLARNFDFEGGATFDLDKVLVVVRPQEGHGFVSIAWAGMAGVVSGMNEVGLALTLNAGASQDHRRVGAPTTILVRRALEQARYIDEAVAVLTSMPRFVTDIVGLADRSGRVAVLELTPGRHALREGDLVVATNHLESRELANDPVSLARAQQTTTMPRRRRLEQLTGGRPSTVGPTDLLGMLRDRGAASGAPLPLAHRHAVDALIATHSVIFDATAGLVWVSQGPHTLGPYHGYDVSSLLAARTPQDLRKAFLESLPADGLLPSFEVVRAARAAVADAEEALGAGQLERATRSLDRASRALADHPRVLDLRGRLALARGEPQWGRAFFEQALAAPPEYPGQAAELQAQIAAIGGVDAPVVAIPSE